MFFYYISVFSSKQYISWIIHTFYVKAGKNHLVIYTKTASFFLNIKAGKRGRPFFFVELTGEKDYNRERVE